MKNLNTIKKKISKDDRKVTVNDLSKLLEELFFVVVIQFDETYIYES